MIICENHKTFTLLSWKYCDLFYDGRLADERGALIWVGSLSGWHFAVSYIIVSPTNARRPFVFVAPLLDRQQFLENRKYILRPVTKRHWSQRVIQMRNTNFRRAHCTVKTYRLDYTQGFLARVHVDIIDVQDLNFIWTPTFKSLLLNSEYGSQNWTQTINFLKQPQMPYVIYLFIFPDNYHLLNVP